MLQYSSVLGDLDVDVDVQLIADRLVFDSHLRTRGGFDGQLLQALSRLG